MRRMWKGSIVAAAVAALAVLIMPAGDTSAAAGPTTTGQDPARVMAVGAEARSVQAVPGVLRVTQEEPVVPLMDASLPQIQAIEAWADSRVGGRAAAGRGVRIAVIDNGITASHPMFDDAGFTAPRGFPRASLTIGETTTPYTGADLARYTNDKVIVARAYANPEVMQPGAGGQPPVITPLANVFHGAHVAGMAAGSAVETAAPSGTTVDVSGVAPAAYLMAYEFDNAYMPEILKVIDDAVADGGAGGPPDAPGTNIRSANTTAQGEPNGLTAATGTSMASPLLRVAGRRPSEQTIAPGREERPRGPAARTGGDSSFRGYWTSVTLYR